MKRLTLILLILSVFFLLIYASSETSREVHYKKSNNSPSISPRLERLRACSEDEFNCNLIGEDYGQCVKKFKICNHQIRCSNEDQLECPLCAPTMVYCDSLVDEDKCVQLGLICSDSEAEQLKCSSNQTIIENACKQFELSLPNTPKSNTSYTTTDLIDSSDSTISSLVVDNFTESLFTQISTQTIFTESTSHEPITLNNISDNSTSSSTLEPETVGEFINESTTSSNQWITQQTTTEPSITTNFAEESISYDEESTSYDEESTNRTTIGSTNATTIESITETTTPTTNQSTQQSIESTKHVPSTGPHNIMDYSKMFKHDYGGFNFSSYIYKGDNKGGKFDWNSFTGGKGKKTGDDNKLGNSFFDFSKFMKGDQGGFDYSKYMGGTGGYSDYSKYLGGTGKKTEANESNLKSENKNAVNGETGYSQYMKQYTSGGQQDNGNYSKYMNSGNDKNGDSKEWGSDSYNYSAYKQSGLKSKDSKGYKFQNDVKSGQKNQDKYAKGYYEYSGYMNQNNETSKGGATYDTYYSGYIGDNQTGQHSSKLPADVGNNVKTNSANKENQMKSEPTANNDQVFDYSKYMSQYASSGGQGGFDYSKYMSGAGGQQGGYSNYYSKYMSGGQQGANHKEPNLQHAKGDDLIKLTGSRQPTKSFTNWFDYSKYLKPGNNQANDQNEPIHAKQLKSQNQLKKKSEHRASYLRGFNEKFSKFQEAKQNEIREQSIERMKGSDSENEQVTNKQSSQLVKNEPNLLAESNEQINQSNQIESENNLGPEQVADSSQPQYHHIQMQNQKTKFEKQPSVNVSKIIPRMMSNNYNYTHYGSGVFFINFGTIVNGNNNVNGDGNDVGNGNGNGNNNGNTQGDNMRGYDFNQANKNPPASPAPAA